MLTDSEKKAIDHEAALYPRRDAAAIEALKIVQSGRGWISDESLNAVAAYLGMPAAELEGVATFYNMIYRRPVGRHVIKVCTSVSCMIMDGESVSGYLFKKLGIRYGETTGDDRFTLLPNSCLGDCDHAPSLMIDDQHFNKLTPAMLDGILEQFA